MKTIDYRFNLDLHAEGAQLFRNVQQGDTAIRLVVTFSEEGKPYPLDTLGANKVIAFAAAKADNQHVYTTECTVDGNSVVITLPQQATAAAGMALCQFKLIDGGLIKASPMFGLNVCANPHDEQEIIPSSTDFIALTNLIATIQSKLDNHEFDGADGISATHSWNGTVLTVTSASGTSSADLKGNKGDKGDKGDTGATGAKGDKGDKGDDGIPYINKSVPPDLVTGEPDVTSEAFAALHKGESFYTPDSVNQTRIFYIKHTNNTYLRLGVAGSEYLPEVPYTTITTVDQQTKRVPNVSTHAYSLLACGQLFVCETATETMELWVKLSRTDYFKYDKRIQDLIDESISGKMDLVPIVDPPDISGVKTGQIFGSTGGYAIKTESGYTELAKKSDIPTIPTNVSSFTNDAGYLTQHQDISNKADKSETYTKNQVDNLISAVSTLSFEVVQALPTTDIKTNVIYLLPKQTPATRNIYEEWAYINSNWELLGTTDIDISGKADKATTLAGYGIIDAYTKADVNGLVNGLNTAKADRSEVYSKTQADSLLSGKVSKQTSLPQVATVEQQGQYVVDTTDSSFQNLAITQMFAAEISEVVYTYQKTGVNTYIMLTGLAHTSDIDAAIGNIEAALSEV